MSAGRIFERVFATIRHNPGPTLGLAFLIGAVPGLLSTYFMRRLQQPVFFTDSDSVTSFYALTLASFVLGLVINALTQAALTRSTVAQSEGRKASLGECLAAGFAVILPLVGLSILLALGVAFGFLLLIVPGIILYLIWSVAVPALVEERRGVFGSFARSSDLTYGAKWKIFGVMLVVLVVYWLASTIPVLAISSMDLTDAEGAFRMPTGFIIANLAVGTLVNLFWGLVQASLYVELRDWKDGPATARLEEVFG